jgi:hypothetical protein
MQRTGLIHISSMVPCGTPRKQICLDHSHAPWNTHAMKCCEHQLVARLKSYPSGPRAKMQCIKCGQGVGAFVPRAGVTDLWDEELEQRVMDDYNAACDEYREANKDFWAEQRGEKSREWWQMYNRYLRTPTWHTKRQLVLDRCGGICESCGQNEAEQVHHLKYPDTFGLEPLWDLRAVCLPCHRIIHPHME